MKPQATGRTSPAATTAIGAIAIAVGPAVSGILAANALGPSGRGDLAIALAAVGLASVVGLRGLDTAVLSIAGSPWVGTDRSALDQVVNQRVLQTAIVGGVCAGSVFVLLGDPEPRIVGFLLVMLLTGLSADLIVHRAWGFASERTTAVFALDVLGAAVAIAGAFFCVILDGEVSAFLVATALGVGVAGTGWRVVLRRTEIAPGGDHRNVLCGLIDPIARQAFRSKILLTTAFRADRLILGAIAGSSSVGLYAAAIPFGEAASLVPFQIAHLVTVRTSRDGGASEWWRYRESQAAIAAAVAVASVVFLGAEQLIDLFFGSDFADAVVPLRLLCVASVFGALWRLSEAELFGRRKPVLAVRASLVAALAVTVITAVGASRFEAAAAAAASAFAYALAFGVVTSALRRERADR